MSDRPTNRTRDSESASTASATDATTTTSSYDPFDSTSPSTTGTSSTTTLTPPSASISSSTPTSTRSTTPSQSDAGTIAGSVIGSVLFLALLLLGVLLYLRARKRRRTPPSSEFMNSLKDGSPPVLRLDSGAEYSPALPEKSGLYYPPTAPLPSYYASPPLQEATLSDEMVTDNLSRRQSIEKLPLRPQRYSSQSEANDVFVSRRHRPNDSIASRRDMWGRETEVVPEEPASLPPKDSHFVPRFSFDDPRTSLQPLRRQQE